MYTNFNYINKGKHERKQAKAYLEYIGSRPGKDKAVMERVLFGNGGPRLTPEQVTRLIDESPDNTLFWRLKLNPDPALENPEKLLDLRDLTINAVRWLEMRLGQEGMARSLPFAAAIHDDHSPHVHAIIFMERAGREKPITPQLLDEFRDAVSALALTQVTDRREMLPFAIGFAKLIGLQPEVEQEADLEALNASLVSDLQDSNRPGGATGSIDGSAGTSCPSCLVGSLSKRLNSRVYECDVCGYAERLGRMIREGRRKEAERARSL